MIFTFDWRCSRERETKKAMISTVEAEERVSESGGR